jgi:spermidine synthase
MRLLLLISITVIATCGLVYELVAGALASYLLGDSVTQFSTIIGVYLFAMGVGSYLSKYLRPGRLLLTFVVVELLIGIVGGLSSTALFILFNYVQSFRLTLYGLMFTTGALVGIEIPLMMQILKKEFAFEDLVANVFSFDYAGALLASLAFPLFFVPHLGLIRTSLFFGLINISVAIVLIFFKQKELRRLFTLKVVSLLSFVLLLVCFVMGESIMHYVETLNYNENVIYSKSSKYQRITITADKQSNKLYLNGNLQFSTADEYRYHEALVHPVFTLHKNPKNILILGGGDGCAAREVLKYSSVKKVTLVDLDAEMTTLFKSNPMLSKINQLSFSNPRVKIINDDAFIWLKKNKELFDIVIVDFPDPSNYSIGKLYSTAFYSTLKKALNKESKVVIQSTSPYVAPNSFWCIVNSMNAVGYKALPYHIYLPSFGDWGYVMGSLTDSSKQDYKILPEGLRYFDSTAFSSMTVFAKDMDFRSTEINRLNNQALVHYFEKEWGAVQ